MSDLWVMIGWSGECRCIFGVYTQALHCRYCFRVNIFAYYAHTATILAYSVTRIHFNTITTTTTTASTAQQGQNPRPPIVACGAASGLTASA
jgi:hypothetical protein